MPKLSQKNSFVNHLIRNQLTSLILHEKIITTLPKAKKLKPAAERLLWRAKKNDLNARRYVQKLLFDKKAIAKIFQLIVPKLQSSKTGFIRLYRFPRRQGDNAQQAIIMLTESLQTIPAPTAPKTKIKSTPPKTNRNKK